MQVSSFHLEDIKIMNCWDYITLLGTVVQMRQFYTALLLFLPAQDYVHVLPHAFTSFTRAPAE